MTGLVGWSSEIGGDEQGDGSKATALPAGTAALTPPDCRGPKRSSAAVLRAGDSVYRPHLGRGRPWDQPATSAGAGLDEAEPGDQVE